MSTGTHGRIQRSPASQMCPVRFGFSTTHCRFQFESQGILMYPDSLLESARMQTRPGLFLCFLLQPIPKLSTTSSSFRKKPWRVHVVICNRPIWSKKEVAFLKHIYIYMYMYIVSPNIIRDTILFQGNMSAEGYH